MKDEYDFSSAKKVKPSAKQVKELKVVKTFRLDLEVIEWLEAEGAKQGMGYQTFLNWFLRRSMGSSATIEERLKKLEQAVFKKR